jgi:hypothetical protein
MPIIEPARPGTPLTQGDILSGVALFATKGTWEEKGGQAAVTKAELCLVLSRPCAAAHKKHVVVAGIAKYPDAVPKGIDSFDKVLDFLTSARDGGSSPDVFYLGQLPRHTGRFCARLDSLHTIEVPEDKEQREQFLAARRRMTLHPDFSRDLHLRVFGTFANLGFDDHRWPSTEDLQWLVTQGQADVASAALNVRQLEAQQASRGAEGTQFKEADLTNARERLKGLQERVAPYEQELERRQRPTD